MKSTYVFDLSIKQIGYTALSMIYLKNHSVPNDGLILITPEMTSFEVDANVDNLIRELEVLRSKAKLALQ